jgi:peroxin-5
MSLRRLAVLHLHLMWIWALLLHVSILYNIPHAYSRAASVQPAPGQSFAASPFMASGMYGLGMSGFNQMPYAAQYNPVADKGKGRSLDVDFDAAFADVTASLSTTRLEPSRIVELKDGEEGMENVSQLDSVLSGAFDQSAPQASSSSDLDQLAGFEADFQQWMDQKREEGEYDFDYGAEMQAAWQNDVKANPDTGLKFNDEGIPDLGLYRFGRFRRLIGRRI